MSHTPTREGDRLFPASDTATFVAARSTVAQARDEVQAAVHRLPRPEDLAWRSLSASQFAGRIDDLRDHLTSAVSVLDAVASALETSISTCGAQ